MHLDGYTNRTYAIIRLIIFLFRNRETNLQSTRLNYLLKRKLLSSSWVLENREKNVSTFAKLQFPLFHLSWRVFGSLYRPRRGAKLGDDWAPRGCQKGGKSTRKSSILKGLEIFHHYKYGYWVYCFRRIYLSGDINFVFFYTRNRRIFVAIYRNTRMIMKVQLY